MRRRKATTMQINVRLDVGIVHELEARAKANRVSFSEEARQRLINSLNPPSLAGALEDFKRRARDIVEHNAPKEKIEDAWRSLQALDAACAVFYTAAENELSAYVRDPSVRQMLRGSPAPVLPDETKSKP